MAAITAAVVGVIANLTLWFALHVLFARLTPISAGPITLDLPDLASIDWKVLVIALGSAMMIFRLRLGIITTLGVCALAGLVLAVL